MIRIALDDLRFVAFALLLPIVAAVLSAAAIAGYAVLRQLMQ